MPKVLLLTGDAAEDLEVMYPYQRLLEEGYEVDIAAPTEGWSLKVRPSPDARYVNLVADGEPRE